MNDEVNSGGVNVELGVGPNQQPGKKSKDEDVEEDINAEDLLKRPSPEQKEFMQYKKLTKIIDKLQAREKWEEVDYLQSFPNGGIRDILDGLKTSISEGIDRDTVEKRVAAFGSNKVATRPPKTFCEICWETLDDFVMKILILCAIITLVINLSFDEDKWLGSIDGLAILFAVFLCTIVAAVNDFQKEKQFQHLQKVAENQDTLPVIRNGLNTSLNPKDLVVGDLVQIKEGQQISVDGILVKSNDITIDESAMTGETDAIKKGTLEQAEAVKKSIPYEDLSSVGSHKVPSPILLSGTEVQTGEGLMIVLVVGKYSCSGKIQAKLAQESEDTEGTPLQQKLEVIATHIGYFGLIGASLTVFALTLILIIREIGTKIEWVDDLRKLLHYFIIGVAIVVMAIPEGLPLAVTLSLAFSVKKMLKTNNLVRKLQACETMGGANQICSDKTGTLTENKMTLKAIWNETHKDIDEQKKEHTLGQEFGVKDANLRHLIRVSFACNASAMLQTKEIQWNKEEKKNEEVTMPPRGNKTEIALLKFINKCQEGNANLSYDKLRERYIPEDGIRYPFSSSRKRMTTQVKSEDGTSDILVMKGASEYVIRACKYIQYWQTGSIVPITPFLRNQMLEVIQNLNGQQLRTLGLAYKNLNNVDMLSKETNKQGVYDIETDNFTLICIVGIRDVLRASVKDAIQKCKTAGIKVRMVTGDNMDTAEAIAVECKIIEDKEKDDYVKEEHVWLGTKFWDRIGGLKEIPKKDSDGKPMLDSFGKTIFYDKVRKMEEFNKIYEKIDVIARCRPEDKYAMVIGLIDNDCVVAVTGDGTNDAPALKRSDVGFAMKSGTKVAQEASDIILLDDNFTSIVEAVKWGRNIYDSVRKFLQFQLTINLVAVASVFICSIFLEQAILTPVQMLWINLIMDTFAALALATEPPHEKLLLRHPHKRDDYIISGIMGKHILMQSVFQIIILIVVTFWGQKFIPENYRDTDSKVQKHLEKGGGYKKLMEAFEDSIYDNPFEGQDLATFTKNVCIMECDGKIRSGRNTAKFGKEHDYYPLYDIFGPSRHFTFIFNVFVWMQIFNFLNARKIEDEVNIFENITKSSMFIAIVVLIIVLQFCCVQFCYYFLAVSKFGLSLVQWLICIGIGLIGLPLSVIFKFVKIHPPPLGNKQQPMFDETGKRQSSILALGRKTNSMQAGGIR